MNFRLQYFLLLLLTGLLTGHPPIYSQAQEYTCGEDIATPPCDIKQYIKAHLHYPEEAAKAGIQGKIYISFLIDTSGNPHHFAIAKGRELGHGLPEEALRIIQSIPGKWQPGKQGGQPVPCYYMIPVTFLLE